MADNQAKARSPLGLEKLNGNKSLFTMWKDKVLTHVQQLDHEHEIKTLEKGQPEPTVTMVDFLMGTPKKPVISVSEPPDAEADKKDLRWRMVYYNRAMTGMRNLFNQTLPHASYLRFLRRFQQWIHVKCGNGWNSPTDKVTQAVLSSLRISGLG
ncbi:hypothetical protein PI124_g9036 [Phytophthora idaei]|nr:hypothetical protein PI125_g13151 [Phytophthora idaei]KAG3149084.1 hypothetical protein PI126_g12195 [Phytophthora idaei]KAG3246231.1 hypothetical protein PI124_g9036 [Phytophthora idaei]